MSKRILLFLVDGMRPDGMQQAETPIIDGLMATGAWTLTARTVMPSITLPCIVSLFQSRTPQQHGVTSNTFIADAIKPGLIEVLAAAGRTVATFHNWEQLRDLSRPGALRASLYLNNCHDPDGAGDTALTVATIESLRRDPVDLAFIYLGYTDVAGHDHSWMSAPYVAAIENADRCIGLALSALGSDYGIVITADHGGHDHSHGTDTDEDMRVPLVIHGHPRLTQGQMLPDPVSIIDVAPTILDWMEIAPPDHWVGRAIEGAR
ncbi:MAG: alkaline phosphatase family protein [Anaerolineae bacterium]|nr:alkaline phosphatase family protein [Anaerolineae bacterium]